MTLLLPSLPALPHLAPRSSSCLLGEPRPGGAGRLRSLPLTTATLSLPMAQSLTWQEFPFSSCPWMPGLRCIIQCVLSASLLPTCPPPPPLSNSDSVLSSLRTWVLRIVRAGPARSPLLCSTCLSTLAAFSAFVPSFKQCLRLSANHPRFFRDKVAGCFPPPP